MGNRGSGPKPPVRDQRCRGRCSFPAVGRIQHTCALSSFPDLDGESAGTSEALTAYLRGEETQGKPSGLIKARAKVQAFGGGMHTKK